MNYTNKRALILGLGISGQAAWNFLRKKGANLVGVDQKLREFQNVKILDENESFSYDSIDFIVKSPGISFDHPILQEAKKRKILITSEIELGLLELQNRGKTLFAITGSNGKTTTTLLTTHLLNQSNKRAKALGNVGTSLLSQVESAEEFFIIELSSYQLENLSLPIFDAGVILNITPNHLDRYPHFKDYVQAKFQLLQCLKKGGKLFLHEETKKEFAEFISKKDEEKVATITPLSYRDEGFSLLHHDWKNLAVAIQLCKLGGVEEKKCWEAFSSFQKPPHRIEFVRKIRGVDYINDSKATSVDAVQKAVESVKGKVILIAGGMDKNGNYTSWKELFEGKVRAVLLIGEAAEKIEKEIGNSTTVEKMETLENALKRAQIVAQEGETVLFSPGCSSFDQFSNYEHRGNVFKEIVHRMGENL